MIIVHGENQAASRAYFLQLKEAAGKSGNNLVELPVDVDIGTLTSAVESRSLFGETNIVIMENVFSRRPSQAKKDLTAYLARHADANIYIWEDKDVSVFLKNFDTKLSKRFDLPKHIFTFMNTPTVDLLHKCLETMPVEQIFASLVTRTYKRHLTDNLLKLLELDYKSKISQLPYDLTTGLELYIMEINAQIVRN